MGEKTEIAWCDSTHNEWIGCMKVSAGCDLCYAETLMDTRYHRVTWGQRKTEDVAPSIGTRSLTSNLFSPFRKINIDNRSDGLMVSLVTAMYNVKADCGTIMCICGTAEMIGGDGINFTKNWNPMIDDLFRPRIGPGRTLSNESWRTVTPEQAATALRSYLTTGDARWDLAVA